MARTPQISAGSALALAFDPAIGTPEDPQSERILDSALEIAARVGLGNLTMDAVAEGARLGRMTLYRRFSGRGELIQALVVREARAALAELAAGLDPAIPPAERLADGFVGALRVAREHPLLARQKPTDVLAELNAPGDPTLMLLREFLAAQIRDGVAEGELEVDDVEAAADLLVRIGVSFVLIPGSEVVESEQAARRLAVTMLAPIAGAIPR